MEFWFALIKVTALVVFLIVGTIVLAAGWPHRARRDGHPRCSSDNGWLLPHGLSTIFMALVLVQGVVFAYAGIELVGTAAGETPHPEKIMPRAINSVVVRIAVFYCGSILLLSLLLPASAYSANESPFVTFFSQLGSPELGAVIGSIMNFVVLTAALSSLNAGMYSTGRILHSMAQSGASPAFTGRMNTRRRPVRRHPAHRLHRRARRVPQPDRARGGVQHRRSTSPPSASSPAGG